MVNLRLTIGQADNAYLIPQDAVQRDNQGAYVFVVNAGKVEQRRVKTHGLTREDWIVSGSLQEGDEVVIEGLQKIRPGAAAKAVLKNENAGKAGNGDNAGKTANTTKQAPAAAKAEH